MKEFNSILNHLITEYLSLKEENSELKNQMTVLRTENQRLKAENKKIGLYRAIANAQWSANLDETDK